VGDERGAAVAATAWCDQPDPRPANRAIAFRRALVTVLAGVLSWLAVSSLAAPTFTISPPIFKAQDGASPTPSSATDQNAAKRIEEERTFRVNRITVEGFRDPDDRTAKPQVLEQRFSTSLNRGSPELIAGKTYDGCYYDGSYFSCADPLSSALRNLQHALR
jgi:hypothetical protein